ncbi:putative vitellogenin receptor [Thelohanellus kitauei]|uniref:Putative vitellogenin receptor n=1 Tax=Thelohanellus kitauei TaxID=669202 RepID=A0A0C2IK20_THEKT|nr:putative vitellogenin receptor [Thelohanellus kitauei]
MKPINCPEEEGCYSESEKCDGFKDCSDGSDEKKCKGFGYLKSRNHSFNEKICMSKVCDGITDCEDTSDEILHCGFIVSNLGTHMDIRNVNFYAKDDGVVSFAWTHDDSSFPNKNSGVVHKKTDKNDIKIGGHVECERYVLIVKIQDFVIRYLQYTYIKPANARTPYNLQYDKKSQILSWQVTIPKCISPVFYIECYRGMKLIYRNFSALNYVKLELEHPFICKVSTCSKSVFNMSCSQFSDKIGLDEIWIFKYKYPIILTVVTVLLIVILLFVCSVVRKFKFGAWAEKLSAAGLTLKLLLLKEQRLSGQSTITSVSELI